MAVSTRKGSLGRDMPSVGMLVGLLLALTRLAASALLELSSSTSSSWCGLCRWPDWAPHQLNARALAPWACSWSRQGHEPNSAASGTLGSSKRFFCRRWLACSDTLACPWWSLEGLLAAAQNWAISYQKVLVNFSLPAFLSWKQLALGLSLFLLSLCRRIGYEFIMSWAVRCTRQRTNKRSVVCKRKLKLKWWA